MATIHPSRLGLVPQDTSRRASPPRPRSPSLDRENTRDRRRRSRERSGRDICGGHDGRADRDRDLSRSNSKERSGQEPRGGRSPRARRPSPAYGDYKRSTSPGARAPWHDSTNMYPARQDRGRSNGWEKTYDNPSGGSGDYFESRRQQRLNNTLVIWPPSPKAPTRSVSPERTSKRSHRHKRDRSRSISPSDSDSEEERARRRRKEKRRSKKEREHKRSEKRRRTRSSSPAPAKSRGSDNEDQWVEKAPTKSFIAGIDKGPATAPTIPTNRSEPPPSDSSEDDEVGPVPAQRINTNSKKDERQYGGALLRGEGSAMAAFLQDGTDSRIPRRGEIGLTSDEIAKYEAAGYVMSGSRHRVMNAVRMRKENQVISAEEKRGILKLQQEERERREMILREEFQELLKEKLKGSGAPRGA